MDWNVSSNIHPEYAFHVSSSAQTVDEPHAVLALGNFFGDGDIFVKIPWQFLQLSKPSKSLSIGILRTGLISRKLARETVGSLEIKRDANDCIQITARKNPH